MPKTSADCWVNFHRLLLCQLTGNKPPHTLMDGSAQWLWNLGTLYCGVHPHPVTHTSCLNTKLWSENNHLTLPGNCSLYKKQSLAPSLTGSRWSSCPRELGECVLDQLLALPSQDREADWDVKGTCLVAPEAAQWVPLFCCASRSHFYMVMTFGNMKDVL